MSLIPEHGLSPVTSFREEFLNYLSIISALISHFLYQFYNTNPSNTPNTDAIETIPETTIRIMI